MFHVIMGFNMGFNMADMYQFYGDVTKTIWNMMEYDHQTYTCLGKFDHDLTVLPHWKSWFILGKSSPFMAASFRLVKYYNLPRYVPCNYGIFTYNTG